MAIINGATDLPSDWRYVFAVLNVAVGPGDDIPIPVNDEIL